VLRPVLGLLLDDLNVHVLVVTVTVGAVARPLRLAMLASGLGPLAVALMAGLPVAMTTLAMMMVLLRLMVMMMAGLAMFMLVGALEVILELELVNLNVVVLAVLVLAVLVPVVVLEVVLVLVVVLVAIMLEDVLFTMLGVNNSAGRGQAIEDGQGSQDTIGTHGGRAVQQIEL
jgi:hypothetical protein